MNIEEAIRDVSNSPSGSVLVAKAPFTWGAEAMFVVLTEDHLVPEPVLAAGFDYVLGRDDIERLLAFLDSKKISSRAAAEFVIHYALFDCPPSWIDDIPDRPPRRHLS